MVSFQSVRNYKHFLIDIKILNLVPKVSNCLFYLNPSEKQDEHMYFVDSHSLG
uniref:Uncharacterized protein n=1 Tax=Rhizophora mucronata TaxID=61149 RepID=A0A2P2N282_RHIMU